VFSEKWPQYFEPSKCADNLFKIFLIEGGKRHLIFQKEINREDSWKDYAIDISDMKGKKVTIRIEGLTGGKCGKNDWEFGTVDYVDVLTEKDLKTDLAFVKGTINRLVGMVKPEYGQMGHHDAKISIEVSNGFVYFNSTKSFEQKNGTCSFCSIFAFLIVRPKYECVTFDKTTYCPEQNKKLSEILKEFFQSDKSKEISLGNLYSLIITPIKIDNKEITTTDFNIKWDPSEDELILMAEKNITNILEIKNLKQEVNLITTLPPTPNEHCLEFRLPVTTQTSFIKVPNYIKSYNSSCEMVTSKNISKNQLMLITSCYLNESYPYACTVCFS
jgi:hypothetical protein